MPRFKFKNFISFLFFLAISIVPLKSYCNWQDLISKIDDPNWDVVVIYKDGMSKQEEPSFMFPDFVDDVKNGKRTIDEYVKYWIQAHSSSVIRGGPCLVISRDSLPPIAYRYAWVLDHKSLSVDIEKAKFIHWAYLRAMRNLLLQRLDVDFFKASENYGLLDLIWYREVEKIKRQKNILRDLPQTYSLDMCHTPEELLTAIPKPLQEISNEVFDTLVKLWDNNSRNWNHMMFILNNTNLTAF